MVSAATEAATSASISTPVCAVVSADATISTSASPSPISTPTCVSGSGWQSGISSLVRFAAWMPASLAVTSASPFGSEASCPTVSGATRTTARATARRRGRRLSPGATHRPRHRAPAGERLVADVHHPHLAGLVHVGELIHDPDPRPAGYHGLEGMD